MAGPRAVSPPWRILLGISRIARGRPDGFDLFDGTRDGFLASLAPFLAFSLVFVWLAAFAGEWRAGLIVFLSSLCALLAGPVVTHALASAWGREAQWLRYATASNWCQWLAVVVIMAVVLAVLVLQGLGVPPAAAQLLPLIPAAIYAQWLQWFLARHGLGIGGWRAALVVVATDIAVVLLGYGPAFVSLLLTHLQGVTP